MYKLLVICQSKKPLNLTYDDNNDDDGTCVVCVPF